jgi:hypothetical protein
MASFKAIVNDTYTCETQGAHNAGYYPYRGLPYGAMLGMCCTGHQEVGAVPFELTHCNGEFVMHSACCSPLIADCPYLS